MDNLTVAAQTHGYASRVQFRLACSKIPKDVILLEIGPHALMRSPLRQNRSDLQYVATMKKGDSAVDTLKAAVADLWRKGASIRWSTSATPTPSAVPEREALACFLMTPLCPSAEILHGIARYPHNEDTPCKVISEGGF